MMMTNIKNETSRITINGIRLVTSNKYIDKCILINSTLIVSNTSL